MNNQLVFILKSTQLVVISTILSMIVFAPTISFAKKSDSKQEVIADGAIPATIRFAKKAPITRAIRKECELPEKLEEFLVTFGEKEGLKFTPQDGPVKKGRHLTIEIVDANDGKGIRSFQKSMRAMNQAVENTEEYVNFCSGSSVAVIGNITEDGKVIGSFQGCRGTSGGWFGGYKGVCAKLGRCVKTLGRDIAEWATDPQMDEIIGE